MKRKPWLLMFAGAIAGFGLAISQPSPKGLTPVETTLSLPVEFISPVQSEDATRCGGDDVCRSHEECKIRCAYPDGSGKRTYAVCVSQGRGSPNYCWTKQPQ
jgi:hypothetical protein